MKPLNQGILISVEGIDGSGKSTFALNLYNKLIAEKIPTVLTKQPGGTKLGVQLRNILHERPFEICPKSEYLLFAADRAQHIESIVQPALNKNKIVISDRMGDSSVVYQGYARGLDTTKIETINLWAMNNIKPDITFYIQLSPEQAIQRIKQRNLALTSFEKEGIDFIKSLVLGFETIFKKRSNVIWLDGTQSPKELTEKAFSSLSKIIAQQHE